MRQKSFGLGRRAINGIPRETIILGYKNGIPIIKAFLKDNQAVFWCKYCKRFHYHGPMDGHRVAHCTTKDSPFHERGYILKVYPRKCQK